MANPNYHHLQKPMKLTETWQYDRLRQRRDWLDARQKAKASVGWDTQYDCEERDALTWVLDLCLVVEVLPKIEVSE